MPIKKLWRPLDDWSQVSCAQHLFWIDSTLCWNRWIFDGPMNAALSMEGRSRLLKPRISESLWPWTPIQFRNFTEHAQQVWKCSSYPLADSDANFTKAASYPFVYISSTFWRLTKALSYRGWKGVALKSGPFKDLMALCRNFRVHLLCLKLDALQSTGTDRIENSTLDESQGRNGGVSYCKTFPWSSLPFEYALHIFMNLLLWEHCLRIQFIEYALQYLMSANMKDALKQKHQFGTQIWQKVCLLFL
jgi:hypothetical protein